MDGAKFHTSDETKQEMEALNIEPVINVAYRFEYNPLERLWGQLKQQYRKVLLQKMLEGPGPKDTPLLDALQEVFVGTMVSVSIPRFIKKAQGILRRKANEIRRHQEIEELDDIE